jgi:hypothetical protein
VFLWLQKKTGDFNNNRDRPLIIVKASPWQYVMSRQLFLVFDRFYVPTLIDATRCSLKETFLLLLAVYVQFLNLLECFKA